MFDYQEPPAQIIYVEEEKSPLEIMNETIEDVNDILESARGVFEIIENKKREEEEGEE